MDQVLTGIWRCEDLMLTERERNAPPPAPLRYMYNNEMSTTRVLPFPPLELRGLVSPIVDDSYYDNPTGDYVWGPLDFPPLRPGEAYRNVLDFGCGCGREARQLLLQRHPPEKYVGVDVNKTMIKWCRANLATDRAKFFHHDVWSSTYAKDNHANRVLPIKQLGSDFSIIEACSVFTHLSEDQSRFYLDQMRSMLAPRGIIQSSWLLFNKKSFAVMTENQNTLFVSEFEPAAAVYYDWDFVVRMVRALGYRIIAINWADTLGHQTRIYLSLNPEFADLSDRIPPGATVIGF
jgi:SAM-dependent methyltransferase